MWKWSWTAGVALMLTCGVAVADDAVVVDTAFVEQAAGRGAILWDVRSEEEYKRGHIPGAMNMDDPQTELRDSRTEDYLPVPQMEAVCTALVTLR